MFKSLTIEPGWARVQQSQARKCIGHDEPDWALIGEAHQGLKSGKN